MSDRAQQQQAQQQEQQAQGGGGNLPPGMEPMIFGPWTTTNTNGSRPGIKDEELYFTDNFMPVGAGRFRTLPDVGSAVFTASGSVTVVFFDFFNIGLVPYCLVLLSDGSLAVFVTSPLGAPTVIAPPGTVTTPVQNQIGITQWGSQFVLIVVSQANGYFISDGVTFYSSGASVPGFGTVPSGVGGTAIEIYQQHVWIADGATIIFSAPQDITDFSTGSGGGSFTSVDSFLRVFFTSLKSTNGFLYLIADSSINYISGVATSGVPPTTTFTNQNADPEVGAPWSNAIDVLSSNIVMANWWGAHISYGGRVNKISEPMDGVFLSAPFPSGFVPSSCKAIIYGKRVWCLLIPVLNTITGASANMLMMYSQESQAGRWWLAHQSVPLTYVAHEEVQSLITGYGTDGTSIYKLFQNASASLSKSFQTKLKFPRGGYFFDTTASRLWGLAEIFNITSASLSVGIDNESSSAATALALPGSATTGALVSVPAVVAVAQQGTLLGLTVTTNAADVSVISLAIASDVWSYKG